MEEMPGQKAQRDENDVCQVMGPMVIEEIAKLAFSDVGELFRPDGTMIPFNELPSHVAAAVVCMETSEVFSRGEDGQEVLVRRTVKIELADKVKNLELLGRHLGLFPGDTGEPGGDPA